MFFVFSLLCETVRFRSRSCVLLFPVHEVLHVAVAVHVEGLVDRITQAIEVERLEPDPLPELDIEHRSCLELFFSRKIDVYPCQ